MAGCSKAQLEFQQNRDHDRGSDQYREEPASTTANQPIATMALSQSCKHMRLIMGSDCFFAKRRPSRCQLSPGKSPRMCELVTAVAADLSWQNTTNEMSGLVLRLKCKVSRGKFDDCA